MKTLYVYSDINCSCTRKNTFEIQKGFQKLGYIFDVVFCANLTKKHFEEYDVITFQRIGGNGVRITQNYFDQVDKLIREYKGNTLTCYTIDDLLPDEFIGKFMKEVDFVLTPNELYKKHYGQYNPNFEHFHTFVDIESFQNIKAYEGLPEDKFKMIWASTQLVGKTFMEKLIPAIVEEFEEDLLIINGFGAKKFLKYFKKTNRMFYTTVLNFQSYVSLLKSSNLLLNPISNDPPLYYRGLPKEDILNCKSELKYTNASICKIPIISSKSLSYNKAIKNGVNGFLLDNDVDLWVNAIKKIKEDKKYTKKIVEKSYEDVTKNYSLKKVSQDIYNIYNRKLKSIEGKE